MAKRSIRLLPIRGSSMAEIWQSTRDFLDRNLGLGGAIMEAMIDSIAPVVSHQVMVSAVRF